MLRIFVSRSHHPCSMRPRTFSVPPLVTGVQAQDREDGPVAGGAKHSRRPDVAHSCQFSPILASTARRAGFGGSLYSTALRDVQRELFSSSHAFADVEIHHVFQAALLESASKPRFVQPNATAWTSTCAIFHGNAQQPLFSHPFSRRPARSQHPHIHHPSYGQ